MKCPECKSPSKKSGLLDGTFGKQTCRECLTEWHCSASGVRPVGKNRVYDPPYKAKHKGAKLKCGIPNPTPIVEAPIVMNGCMNCGCDLQSTFGSVRARMLKGYGEQKVESATVDPTTGRGMIVTRSFPTFKVGRVCLKCQSTLTISDTYMDKKGKLTANPQSRDEYEILQERVTLRTVTVVTKKLVEMEDQAQEKVVEAEKVFYSNPSKRFPSLRVKQAPVYVPPDKDEATLNALNNHHTKVGDKRVETDINLKGYRKYGGGSRGGVKNYDIEVNFDNISKPSASRR